MGALELWGGPECTVSRVDDRFSDQLRLTGHHDRDGDIDLIAALGVVAVRYPVLWERVAPDDPRQCDWTWSDRRLHALRDRAIRPIVGLVHHGSGPRYTNLLDDGFAAGVGRHAAAVARRYPWVQDWTPINEPCTTARFACLYGHWYPHRRDERSFWRALLNQIDATRLAMRAVRAVNPGARLVQTDDLGRTYATAAVRDQAGFDNTRRWMGWDLLAGHVVPGHALWTRIGGFGLEERLRAIADDPAAPDIIGVNHYLTSDRFLDHRVRRYPHASGSGSGRAFVDTEAVRVLEPPPSGVAGVLGEAWRRYRTPLAITEAHNGCTREEQMRWTYEAWRAAAQLRDEGVDVRAVTSWSLFGSVDWNTLLTRPGTYEAGAYDVSGDRPRATAMVPLLQALAASAEPAHPVLRGEGWWRRDIRLQHRPVHRPAPMREHVPVPSGTPAERPSPILILGATGTLGRALAAACTHRHIAFRASGRDELDLCDADAIARLLDAASPWAVINAAGWARIDAAELDRDTCMAANHHGAVRLARACQERGIATAGFSSDLVFDGSADRPYVEADAPAPLGVYGRSKALAERDVAALGGTHLIVRTAAFFAPADPRTFACRAVETLARGDRFAAAADQIVSPTYVPDLADGVLDLVIDGEAGIWHLSNRGGGLSWADFARRLAIACDLEPALVDDVAGAELGWRAPRPAAVTLATSRGAQLPPLDEAIGRFAQRLRDAGDVRRIAFG